MTMRVKIDHIGAGGDGVVQTAEGPLYVPFSVDGDDVEIKIQGKKARISHIHQASPDRITPLCKHFGRCGGCALQHVSSDYYGQWKQAQVKMALRHRGIEDAVILPIEISPLASRRRASLTALGVKKGPAVIGFTQRASHNVIDITECPVLAPDIMAFLGPLREFLSPQLKCREKRAIQITLAENGLDVILEGSGEPDLDLRMDMAAFADNQDIARICWQDMKLKNPSYEILCERRKPYVTFDGRQIFIPPGSFLQATKAGELSLTSHLKAALGEDTDKIVDIFAGCGTFTLALIGEYAVHAVEGKADMVTALKNSAHQMGKIRALTTEVRDLFKRPLLPHELKKYDTVIIDPPRAGAKDQIDEIIRSDIKNMVMVSCNPATFARDARTLTDGGFIMGDILPVDQFLYSPHIEIIAGFRRS